MNELNQHLHTIMLVAGAILVAVFGKRWGWFELVSGTNKLLRDQNLELRNQNQLLKDELENLTNKGLVAEKEAAAKHAENQKAIANLQGKIDILAAIPLKNIDESMKAIAKTMDILAESNEKILQQTQKSAEIAAEDRNTPTSTDQHIEHQIVDKQVIGSKE